MEKKRETENPFPFSHHFEVYLLKSSIFTPFIVNVFIKDAIDLFAKLDPLEKDVPVAVIKDVFEDTRSILEPAGALAIAGAKAYVERERLEGQTLVAIACGANMNFDRLRFVAERAELGEHRESIFAVTIPEQAGSLRKFCELMSDRNLTEFSYRIADQAIAHIFVGVQIVNRADAVNMAKIFAENGFAAINITDDELTKLHLRHMVGGRSPLAHNELLYRFEFPERPGALMRFLDSLAPNWNISLFHYRSEGGDVGRVLVGLQVPKKEMKTLIHDKAFEKARK